MLQDVPVILLTVRVTVSDCIIGYNVGDNRYLPKPFQPEGLVGMIDS
jgi:DNA-binding response OmpR family regulator